MALALPALGVAGATRSSNSELRRHGDFSPLFLLFRFKLREPLASQVVNSRISEKQREDAERFFWAESACV